MEFIINSNNNNFINIKGDLSKNFQKELKNNIECPHIIHKDVKWKYVNINPSSPTSRGLIKVHKAESPIRPIVNRTNDPAYKLARMLAKNLEIYIPLPYIFNVNNTIQLMKDLDIAFENDLKFISFDIKNMYANVPVKELKSLR
jgi:hypothetical protein